MSDLQLLADVAADLFRSECPPEAVTAAEADGRAPALWAALENAGFTLTGVPESAGGSGGGWSEAATLLRAAGRFAAPVPLAETGPLAGWLLAAAGRPAPTGPLTLALPRQGDAVTARRRSDGWELSGRVTRVPWARGVGRIVVVVRDGAGAPLLASVEPAGCSITPGANLAGEPRDLVVLDRAYVPAADASPLPDGIDERVLLARGALARACQMAGALDRVLELSIGYARVREQFGRPIGSFQVIQQELVRAAGEVFQAGAAVENAVEAVVRSGGEAAAWAEIAAARVRTGTSAGQVARIAHQVHGAIGFTDEHQLRHFTRRLWSWRDEFGSERYWAEELGRAVAAAGPDELWPLVTRSPA